MTAVRVTAFQRPSPVPPPTRAPATAPLDGLAPAFADRSAAEAWLGNTLRWLGEHLGADRVELFATEPRASDLRLVRSWPPIPSGRRLPLERQAAVPWIASRLKDGEPLPLGDPSLAPDECREECLRHGVASALVFPLRGDGETLGALAMTTDRPIAWSGRALGSVHEVAGAVTAVMAYVAARRDAGEAVAESERLRQRIDEREATRPVEEPDRSHPEIIGRSRAIRGVLERIDQVAPTPAAVLLLGETGTGKELVARAIHAASERRDRAMVKLNCAALPATLVEAELFGREKGAYTGALSRQAGRFEIADGSTLFLDEVGELAPEIQVKLLRVLQEGEFERIGSTKTQRVNVRLIAATNRDLARMVREGRFREDLYYRLNVFPIRVPPLRDRREDVPLLVWSFVQELARSLGRPVERIAASSIELLERHAWPGNVRELRNAVERAMILHRGPTLRIDVPESERGDAPASLVLADVERRHLLTVLEMTGWRIRGKNGAAEIVGLKPTTLESRLEKLGIVRPQSPIGAG